MKLVAILCLVLTGAGAHANPTNVEDPDTLQYLRAVHNALGTVSRAITACANDGGNRQECVCMHKDLVLDFHATVRALLKAHPEVAEYGTINFSDENGGTIAQNIAAMIRQTENPPTCK